METAPSGPSPAGPDTAQPGPIARAFQMPVTPGLWRGAWTATAGWVILPLCCLSLVLNFTLGVYRAWELRGWLVEAATGYDERFDTVVYELGTVSIEGDRVPYATEGDVTLLVDPDETIPVEDIHTSEYMVVRKDAILMKRSYRSEERIPLSDVAVLLGEGPIVVDEANLLRLAHRWGPWLQLGVLVFLLVFGLIGDAVSRALYALVVAAVVHPWFGQAMGGDFGASFRVALATSSTTLLVGFVLHLAGTGPGCASVIIWPTLMVALTFWAVQGIGTRSP